MTKFQPDWPEDSHDLPQSPITAHEPAPFLALRARRQSPLVLVVLDALRPPARRSLRRTQAPLIVSDCLGLPLIASDGRRHRCKHFCRRRCRRRCSRCGGGARGDGSLISEWALPWALSRSLAARMKTINEMRISCAPGISRVVLSDFRVLITRGLGPVCSLLTPAHASS